MSAERKGDVFAKLFLCGAIAFIVTAWIVVGVLARHYRDWDALSACARQEPSR